MKGVSIIILSFVFAAAVIYGVGGFIAWEFNPENWGSLTRFFAIICWLIGSFMVSYLALVLIDW